jgi:hypothetical protein
MIHRSGEVVKKAISGLFEAMLGNFSLQNAVEAVRI